MKIENTNSSIRRKLTDNLNELQKGKSAKTKKGDKGKAATDQASISSEAQILAKSTMELKNTPEVRQALITDLKDQILEGKYSIQYEELARTIQSILE